MNIYIGIALLAALLVALALARRAYRREKQRRRRLRRAGSLQELTTTTARSDMRAFEDPGMVMDTVRRPGVRKEPPSDGKPSRGRIG
jgi:hypothetical protein